MGKHQALTTLLVTGLVVGLAAPAVSQDRRYCPEVGREIREAGRESMRERREARRDLYRSDNPWEAREAVREGAREVYRERREARREIRREIAECYYGY